jgi:DNA invertase Pin-like site-specific DNA recombinase
MSEVNSTLTPAVAYLRKSTKGRRKDAGRDRQKQEKSLAQQKAEILKLARGRFTITKWFEDEGISGSKRGAGRPSFASMLAEVKVLGAKAVLCDALDRFSRASYSDVEEDARSLRKAGAVHIVTVSEGEFKLGSNDIGDIIKFAAVVWGAHEYSRNLARRIALARRNAAEKGKRTGGRVAYGLKDEGGVYVWGDPQKAETVRWLFTQFADEARSISSLTGQMNARKVPGPDGGAWYVKNVANLLRRPCYRGDFVYGQVPAGNFFRLNDQGEVVEKAAAGEGKVYRTAGAYRLIDPALFDRAQARLAVLANNRGRRKRGDYVLTGILVCDHCGSPMHGTRHHAGDANKVYRCGGTLRNGKGTCRRYQVREAEVLPLVMRLLAEEVENVLDLLSKPPDEVDRPWGKAAEKAEAAKAERVALALKIEKAVMARIESDDKRTRQDYDRLISKWRDELDRLDAEADPAPAGDDFDRDYIKNLHKWFRGDNAAAVPVPFEGDLGVYLTYFRRARDKDGKWVKPQAVMADPRKVNEALHRLGCEVRLRWETYSRVTKDGCEVSRNLVNRGRFRLGQREGGLVRTGGVLGLSARRTPARPSRPGT